MRSNQQSGSGVGDDIAGIVLGGICLFSGGLVFTGDTKMLDYFFNGLGLFWIGNGIYRPVR